jgi:hypothetical protein
VSRHVLVRIGLALSAVTLLVGIGSVVLTRSDRRSEFSQLGEIAYVLPDHLPDGWVVSHATERPGRPRAQWDSRADVLATADRHRFLVLAAHRSDGQSERTTSEDSAGTVHDEAGDDFAYLFGLTSGVDVRQLKGRGTQVQAHGLDLSVVELGAGADDTFVTNVSTELAEATDLEFDIPPTARRAGFQRLASAPDVPTDVTDYTVVWVPRESAGADRSAATSRPEATREIYVNVGCRFYAQAPDTARSDREHAAVTAPEPGSIQMAFLLDGSPVSLAGKGIDEPTLRSVAASLRTYDRASWRNRLGDRLLVDEPH